MEHIKVSSVSEAWRAAARIFPTDYEKNEENSKREDDSVKVLRTF